MRLFAISVGALTPVLGTWPATGMAGSDTLDVDFDEVPAQPVGVPGAYVDRPGFAHGGVGVAACWYGGARAVAGALLSAAGRRDAGPHALAHLGAVDIALRTVHSALDTAADEIRRRPYPATTVTNGPAKPTRPAGLRRCPWVAAATSRPQADGAGGHRTAQ